MGFSVVEGFTKSLAMTVLSEIGDKTFFAAAILAMSHPRRLVLGGCLSSLIVMTALSVGVGWAAPNLSVALLGASQIHLNKKGNCNDRLELAFNPRFYHRIRKFGHQHLQISRKWTHHITTLMFFGFGLWSLWEGFTEEGEAEELAEVEAKLDSDWKGSTRTTKTGSKVDDDLKKQQRPVFVQFFSPIFLKAFSITFFGEWGDKSQIATIGLAADANPFGVVLGGILGQALCTTAAVLGGKSLASKISEKMVALSGGFLFLVFGLQSFLSTVGDS